MNDKQKPVLFKDVSISKDSFWGARQELNHKTTIYSVYNRFVDTGRFEAFKFNWKQGEPNQPHFFWDSDVAKWLEAAAYIIQSEPDETLEAIVDETVDLIAENQGDDGYFNLYFTMVEPEKRWQNRTDHELYCAGHLIEASVAYYESTGKRKFLDLMCKYAEYIEKVFKVDKSAAFITPGHPEIELALVKLYRTTGKRKYLDLSKFFIHSRGQQDEHGYDFALPAYDQRHLPLRQQSTAEGHAVRAEYLYSGMADIAYLYDDEDLLNACKRIYQNIVNKRMYITGGTGSSHLGEAFTIDYDLPNLTAYTETCAAIALVYFSHRMLMLETNSLYSDTIERIIYNGFLSGTSLDGKSFFYENPLEIQPELLNRDASVKNKTRYPIIQRKEVFDCSCCPPNIARFVASIGDYLYSYSDDTFYIHQFMSGITRVNFDDKKGSVTQKTNYPEDGHIDIIVKDLNLKKIAIRVPSWCESYSVKVNGNIVTSEPVKGYLYVSNSSSTMNILIDFKMDVSLIEANPNVQENAGRIAVQRGPIIFCAEAVDNGRLLRDVTVPLSADFKVGKDVEYGFITLTTKAYRRDAAGFDGQLYRPCNDINLEPFDLKLIPYYAFANRGVSEMLVWLNWC